MKMNNLEKVALLAKAILIVGILTICVNSAYAKNTGDAVLGAMEGLQDSWDYDPRPYGERMQDPRQKRIQEQRSNNPFYYSPEPQVMPTCEIVAVPNVNGRIVYKKICR